MGLENPTDNIGTVLTKGAMKLNKFEKRLSHEGKDLNLDTHFLNL